MNSDDTANNLRYARSQAFLKRAIKTVPLGSQTFSKSHISYPLGQSPIFLKSGAGSKVTDIDGNKYIDFVSGLLPVVLGYCDPDVDTAVIDQIGHGVTLSLATQLETQLAETLTQIIPCAEMVRFGKTGSDATAGAVRLARAFTNRDRVAVCGYHGWQDWYIGSTARNLGVPKAIRELTHTFPYNDLEELDRVLTSHSGEFACVIMEAMNITEPEPGYLLGVRDLAHDHGALFILDEVITGFRFSLGGAQELFAVTPDLAAFGKGMGNGYAISAIVGRADVMTLMEEIFFSFTSGGETVGLAASLATIKKMQSENVVAHLWQTGGKVEAALTKKLHTNRLDGVIAVMGKAPWLLLAFSGCKTCTDWELKTLFMQEMLARGILIQSSHNFSFAHTADDIDRLLSVYDEVLPILADAVHNGAISQRLNGPPMEPLFRVR